MSVDCFEDRGGVVADVGWVGAEDELGVAFDGAVLDAGLDASRLIVYLRAGLHRKFA